MREMRSFLRKIAIDIYNGRDVPFEIINIAFNDILLLDKIDDEVALYLLVIINMLSDKERYIDSVLRIMDIIISKYIYVFMNQEYSKAPYTEIFEEMIKGG